MQIQLELCKYIVQAKAEDQDPSAFRIWSCIFKQNIRNCFDDLNFMNRESLWNEIIVLQNECEKRLPKLRNRRKLDVKTKSENWKEKMEVPVKYRWISLRILKKVILCYIFKLKKINLLPRDLFHFNKWLLSETMFSSSGNPLSDSTSAMTCAWNYWHSVRNAHWLS